MKKNIRNLLVLRMALLILLSACAFCVHSQVTVGAGTHPQDFSVLEISTATTTGGLRLPQLSTKERNDWCDYFLGIVTTNPANPSGSSNVTADELINAPGLAIFNTDTKCYEYWNASRWVSLCEGNSLMTISPDPCQNVDAEIPDCDDEFKVYDPDCENGPFTIMIVAGQDYAELTDVNETDGIFHIAFRENNSIYRRSVVVRVTSSCTGLYKDFLFLQNGHACEATLGMAPEITSVPLGKNIDFCLGGAVYLSIDETMIVTPGTLEHVIWTRNNIEIARGVNNLVVTQEGKYDVWMGYVGCNPRPNNTVTVTRSGTGAPQPVDIVVTGNNGMVCGGPSGTTELVALKPNGSGTVIWFKNGVQTAPVSSTNISGGGGVRVEVGIGNWFAVVQDGSCYSLPSETVSVIENPISGSSLTKPVIEKGGSFCAGSSILLSVSSGTYDASYVYIWYENNTQIGIGRSVMYTVSSDAANVVIRCRATQAGSCAVEALEVEAITTGIIPAQPVITGNTVLCAGLATLNVIPQGSVNPGATYAWYKDNTQIGNTQQITVTSGGDYYATVTDGCTSPMAHVNIPTTSSANPVVTLISSSTTPGIANNGDIVTYNASITFGPALNYIWTITGATLVLGGQPGDTYAVVEYSNSTAAPVSALVKVEAFNACGTATTTRNVTVDTNCADPDLTTMSPSVNVTISAIRGLAFTLGPVSVSFTSGSPATSYQWYRSTTPSYSGALLSGKTSNTLVATETTVGMYYYYCTMTNAGCSSSSVNTAFYIVSVVDIPLNAGTGNFTGRTVFDIAYSNFGGDCGAENIRKSQTTDFSLTTEQDPPAGTSTPVYTGTQVYTFTPSGNVSNVRFVYLDASEQAIESMTPKADYSGNISSGSPCKAVVVYKASLNTFLRGRTRANALKPELYVIYNGGGVERSIKMTVSLQDCSACGAVTTSGGWLNFMCHNLGANENTDPFTSSTGLHGDLYQWGRPNDGHQLRNSTTTTTLATSNIPGHADFIRTTAGVYSGDWRSGSGNNARWGDGSSSVNMAKANNDPCPPGWKVPSQKQWTSIFGSKTSPNTWTRTNNGYKIGLVLFLPDAGYRRASTGNVDYTLENGFYYSSTASGNNTFALHWRADIIDFENKTYRANGFSVRCVSEY